MIKTEVMCIPVIPALKQRDVKFQAWLHSEILPPRDGGKGGQGEREGNKEAEVKVVPSPAGHRRRCCRWSFSPSLGVTKAFLGLNSSLVALSYYCGFSEFQILLGKN